MADQNNPQQGGGGKGKNPNRLVVKYDVNGNKLTVYAIVKDDINKPLKNQEVIWSLDGVTQSGSSKTDDSGLTPGRDFQIPSGTKTIKIKGRIAGGPHDEVTADVSGGSPAAKAKSKNLKFIYELVQISDGKYRVHMNLVDKDTGAPCEDEIELSCDKEFLLDGTTILPHTVKFLTVRERGEHMIIEVCSTGTHKIDVSIVKQPVEDADIPLPGKAEQPLQANLDSPVTDVLFRGFQ